MDQILFYARNLAVPARRAADDPTVLRGKQLFYRSGCIGCHVPKLATRRDWEVPALAGQLIWPYTDLLLHDMGEGLADHRPEGVADGRGGGRRRSGASASPRPSTATPIPARRPRATSPRPSSGTAARLRPPAMPLPR